MTKRGRGDDKPSSAEIMSIVKEIYDFDGSHKQKESVFSKKYPEFAENYKMLFSMACDSSFDFDRLQYMLNLRDKIDTKEVTFEAASKEVGQAMFDVYVKDVVPPPPSDVQKM